MISDKRLKELERRWNEVIAWSNHTGFAVPAEIDMVKDILFPEIRRQRKEIKKRREK